MTVPSGSSVVFSGDDVGSERCVDIMTNTDMIVEGDQQFTVSLVSTNAQPSNIVQIDTPSLQSATIQDSNSMFSIPLIIYYLALMNYSTFYTYGAIYDMSVLSIKVCSQFSRIDLIVNIDCFFRCHCHTSTNC